MNPLPVLETDRLVLRPLSIDDAEYLFLIYSHPDAMRFWDFTHRDSAETRAHIEHALASPARSWVLQLRSAPRAIGQIDFIGNEGVPGMGYILHPDYWHQGYMTEAMSTAIGYGFDVLGYDRVELWIASDNTASRRLAHRLGFTRRGALRQKYPQDAVSHEKGVYGLLAGEFRKEPPAPGAVDIYSAVPILGVHDVQVTAEYYRDVLGFSIDFYSGNPPTFGGVSRMTWTTQGVRIQLSQVAPELALNNTLSLRVNVGPDVDVLYRSLCEHGAKVVSEVRAYPWGSREFTVRDCNGYLLRFSAPG